MSKIFKCDLCKKEFGGPLDEEHVKDEHGIWQTFDLCAPCRVGLQKDKDKVEKDFAVKAKKVK